MEASVMADQLLVNKVDHERWQTAQAWERNYWLRRQKTMARYGKNYVWRVLSLLGYVEKYRGNDRNGWWEDSFDSYKFLPASVNNAIEVGCGPYTNMRRIRKVCAPRHLFLSDPLIRTYLGFKMTFVREMYREAACWLDDHPLEELPFADVYFDLAVMINVLDHVRDANLCMENLIRILRPGAFVIIGQDLTDEKDLKQHPEDLKIGHPVTLSEQFFEPYLKKRFDQVLYKVLPREVGWAPQFHYGTLCFAGIKR
jgi:SAM-dependent methyltransferase